MNNIQGSRELKSLIDEVMQFCEIHKLKVSNENKFQ